MRDDMVNYYREKISEEHIMSETFRQLLLLELLKKNNNGEFIYKITKNN